MCGIAGWVQLDGAQPEAALLRPMLDCLRHRGPDDEGQAVLAGGETLLGMMGQRRLAIIDLSPAGRQPMHGEDGRVALVCNGEIYNFRELRERLETQGHRFRSHSDCEVIVHGYEERGADVVHDLDGMFALALWDSREQELLLARDRAGIKPLYYAHDGQRLAFASEVKALLALPWVPRRLDPQALHAYLTYLYVPPPDTMWQGIQKLPPAHRLRFSRDGVKVERYWDVPGGEEDSRPEGAIAQDLWDLWEDVVRTEMVADVPVGVFLSGGLDSGALVAAAAKTGRVRTFTIGFQEGEFDETAAAREIATFHGTEHVQHTVRAGDLDLLDKLVWAFDEPMADSSAIANYRLAEVARQHVKVALSGAGGDEVLGGYYHHAADQLADRLDVIPAPARRALALLARGLPAPEGHPNPLRRLQRFGAVLDRAPEERHFRFVTADHFNAAQKAALFADGLWEQARNRDSFQYLEESFRHAPFREFLQRALYVDLVTYLPGDILTLADRASMAHSLEVRVPFVNRRFVEFLARVPARLKVQGLQTKALWRHTLEGRLPPSILRGKKRGFGVPMRHWFRGERGAQLQELVSASPYFRAGPVARLFAEHRSGVADHAARLWALVLFEHWRRAYKL